MNHNKIQSTARILLGLIFFIFGLNGFLQFIPAPPMTDAAGNFAGALAATGYFFPFLKATEVICGLLLLSGFAAPLALVILAPITLNILLFHGILTPGLQNLIMPLAIIALQITAALKYWSLYAPLFKKNA
jgi:uncharacterized membrane protein YphA (DoxX/SURF4 family)